jgi:hypothetical protein
MSKTVRVIGAIAAYAGAVFIAPFNPAAAAKLVTLGNYFILSAALEVVAQALAHKPRVRRLGQDIEYFGTVEPRRIIYGEMKVSGMNVIPPWTSGPGNKYLQQVIAVAGHEVTAIPTVYFGQDAIAGSSISAVTGVATDGKVVSGPYANLAWIRRYLGTTAQTADYILTTAFTAWTANHRGREVAYLALQYELSDKVYQSGRPDIACLVQGKKCYSARLDTSPGANPTNAAYIVYTTNPADILADYLRSVSLGLGEVATRIDWNLLVAAANICDELVSIPSGTQKRYTCNVVIEVAITEDERRANIRLLVGAMMGHVVDRGGKWRMYAGAAASPTFVLTENHLVGRISFQTETSANQKYNYVRGQFVDADRNYQLSEFEPRSSSAYEATDGDRKPREVTFVTCNNQYEAQRDAIIVLKRSRRKKQVTGLWGMSAFKIRPWDVGTLTVADLGWSSQSVRCLTWSFKQEGTIEATFLEEDSTDWNDPAIGDYTVPSIGAGGSPVAFTPAPPQNFSVVQVQDGVLFSWIPPEYAPLGLTYNIYEYTAAAPFASATKIVSGLTGTSRTVIRPDATVRYYWITAQDRFSTNESDERPLGNGLPGGVLAVTAGFRATASPGGISTSVFGLSSASSQSVTVTPFGGVAPFTYAWVRTSGDTTITANTPSSGTSWFDVTGLALGEYNTAVFRCTVTDSTGGTPLTTTVDVTVSFEREFNNPYAYEP